MTAGEWIKAWRALLAELREADPFAASCTQSASPRLTGHTLRLSWSDPKTGYAVGKLQNNASSQEAIRVAAARALGFPVTLALAPPPALSPEERRRKRSEAWAEEGRCPNCGRKLCPLCKHRGCMQEEVISDDGRVLMPARPVKTCPRCAGPATPKGNHP